MNDSPLINLAEVVSILEAEAGKATGLEKRPEQFVVDASQRVGMLIWERLPQKPTDPKAYQLVVELIGMRAQLMFFAGNHPHGRIVSGGKELTISFYKTYIAALEYLDRHYPRIPSETFVRETSREEVRSFCNFLKSELAAFEEILNKGGTAGVEISRYENFRDYMVILLSGFLGDSSADRFLYNWGVAESIIVPLVDVARSCAAYSGTKEP